MLNILEKYSKAIYIILAICCVIIAYLKKQIFLYPTGLILFLLGFGVLKIDDGKDVVKKEKNDKE